MSDHSQVKIAIRRETPAGRSSNPPGPPLAARASAIFRWEIAGAIFIIGAIHRAICSGFLFLVGEVLFIPRMGRGHFVPNHDLAAARPHVADAPS